MNCDFVYDNNRKGSPMKGDDYALQVRTTFLGEIDTISCNKRLNGNSLQVKDDGEHNLYYMKEKVLTMF